MSLRVLILSLGLVLIHTATSFAQELDVPPSDEYLPNDATRIHQISKGSKLVFKREFSIPAQASFVFLRAKKMYYDGSSILQGELPSPWHKNVEYILQNGSGCALFVKPDVETRYFPKGAALVFSGIGDYHESKEINSRGWGTDHNDLIKTAAHIERPEGFLKIECIAKDYRAQYPEGSYPSGGTSLAYLQWTFRGLADFFPGKAKAVDGNIKTPEFPESNNLRSTQEDAND